MSSEIFKKCRDCDSTVDGAGPLCEGCISRALEVTRDVNLTGERRDRYRTYTNSLLFWAALSVVLFAITFYFDPHRVALECVVFGTTISALLVSLVGTKMTYYSSVDAMPDDVVEIQKVSVLGPGNSNSIFTAYEVVDPLFLVFHIFLALLSAAAGYFLTGTTIFSLIQRLVFIYP